ncbi:MAG: hypothetical protein KatS3mg068_1399 [Candidatus Sericytochromatia bacterium]|nr:MAG: hypothetical protein KatS3mg068_1399 [Candidatus Sericytochromatia bacterium]
MSIKNLVENYRKGILEYKKNNYSNSLKYFKNCIDLNIKSNLLSEIFLIEKEILVNSIKNSNYSLINDIHIDENTINSLDDFIYAIAFYSLKNDLYKANFFTDKAIQLYNNDYFNKVKSFINKGNTISACIICKNNENIIEECLKALLWADEIIVLDTGSTDKTKEISKKYAKVYEYNWEDDFSKARNKALEYCTKEWILFIDSDQIFPEECIDEIKLIIRDTSKIAFHIKIRTNSSFFVNYLRLFRNNFDLKYKGIIHEQIYFSLKNCLEKYKYFSVGDSFIYLMDKSYENTELLAKKKERNIKLLKKAIEIEENIYDKTYYFLKIFETTLDIEYLDIAFNMIKDFEKEELLKYNFCLEIYKYYILFKDFNLIDKALEIFDYSAELHLIKASFLLDEKKYIESKYFYDKSIKLLNNPKNYFSLINPKKFAYFGYILKKFINY